MSLPKQPPVLLIHRLPGKRAAAWLFPLLAVTTSFLLSGLFILLTRATPLEGYRNLIAAGFGCRGSGQCALLTNLQFMTPLLLTGLSAAVAFRAGMFSIGQAGQMVLGAAAASWLSAPLGLEPWFQMILILLAGCLIGGIWGWIAGLLKVMLNIHEVITTLVLNQLAFMVIGAWRLYRVPAELRLSPLARNTKLTIGVFIAVVMAVLLYIFLKHRVKGFEQRMSGEAPRFARFGGIRPRRAVLGAMLLSGGLAGLAGVIEVLGVHYRFVSVFSGGGGFDGVAVALLGQANPLGVAVASFLLAGLRLGATNGLQLKANIPRELAGAMIAMMMVLVTSNQIYIDLWRRAQRLYRRIFHHQA